MSTECQRIYDYAVEKYEERKIEVKQMKDCVAAAIFDSREHGTALINQFLAYKTEVVVVVLVISLSSSSSSSSFILLK